jgi:hypothetical protein
MSELGTADRDRLLAGLAEQLQADHDAAMQAGNVSAAVSASRALADLLGLEVAPEGSAPRGDPTAWNGSARVLLEARIYAMASKVSGGDGGSTIAPCLDERPRAAQPEPERPEDRALAERLLKLLERQA